MAWCYRYDNKSSKIRYIYEGVKLNLNKIYGMNKKRRDRSKYLLSINVEMDKDGMRIPAKIVYVRIKKKRKYWVPFICTAPDLPEEEIIRILCGKHMADRSILQNLQIHAEPCRWMP